MADNSASAAFNEDERAQFTRDGYVIARGLAPAAMVAHMREIALTHLADARDDVFRAWAVSPLIAARLQLLLGEHVALSQAHHNCIMTKNPAYSSVTNWHRDIRYWSFAKPELVSVWLALGEEYRRNGCLLLLTASHRMEFRADQLDAAQFLRTDLDENRNVLDTQISAELHAGDVLFFHCRLFHAAGHNQTADTKLSVVHTYHARDNYPLPGTRSAALREVLL
jgi:phytanoyl-CoA hydroxylase